MRINTELIYRGIGREKLWQTNNTRAESPQDDYCYNCHIKERVNSNMKPDHVPASDSLVQDICNSFWSQDKRVEEGVPIMHWT